MELSLLPKLFVSSFFFICKYQEKS